MRLAPFGKETVIRFIVVIALPLAPLALTMFSLEELIRRLLAVILKDTYARRLWRSFMAANRTRLAIVGAGAVGSTIAYAVMLRELVHEIVLVDAVPHKAEAEAKDLMHGSMSCRAWRFPPERWRMCEALRL